MTIRATATAPFGLATSTGHHRELNEDAALAGPHWFVVADGMGGHRAGDVASRIVVQTFADIVPDGRDPHDLVRATIAAANTNVRRRAATDDAAGMGSTVVGLTLAPTGTVVFHAGDSRCYRLAGGELRLLTRDHSHVQELIDAGRLTTEQAEHHPLRSVITRAIGLDATIAPELIDVDDRPSRFLLCTDGLTTEVGPRAIGRVLAGLDDPQAAADRLVELALDGPARDNITALVVDVASMRDNVPRPDHRSIRAHTGACR
jgi:protein phosphatase